MRTVTLRLTVLLLIACLVTGLSVAQPADDTPADLGVLTALAAHMPQDTLIYAVVRTDEATFDTIDAIMADLTAGFSDAPEISFEDLLSETMNRPFEEIRPWLGDAVAIGMVPAGGSGSIDISGIVVAHLADPAAAEAYLLPAPNFTSIEIRGDILIAWSPRDNDTPADDDASLHDAPTFQAALALLDAPDYAGLLYVDLPMLIARQRGMFSRYVYDYDYGMNSPDNPSYYGAPSGGGFMEAFATTAALRMIGPLMTGITRAPDGDLVLDVATAAGNLNGLRPLGFELPSPELPDHQMLGLVPDDAFAVAQGVNLPGYFVELYRTFGQQYLDGYFNRTGYYSTGPLFPLNGMTADQAADLLLGNALGITLADLLNWSSSDYVTFARLNPDWHLTPAGRYSMPVEAATIFRIGQAEQSFAAFENLARSLQLLRESSGRHRFVDVSVERGADMREVAVTLYPDGRAMPGFTISLIVTDEFAILGAQGAARAALAQAASPELAPWLVEALANYQPGSAFNGALQPSAFVPALSALIGPTSAVSARPFFAKLDALTVDLRVLPDGAAVWRFVISLNDADAMETLLFLQPTLPPPPTAVFQPTLPPPVFMQPTNTPFVFTPETTSELDPILLSVTETVAAATQQMEEIVLTATAAAVLPEATIELASPTFVPTPAPSVPTAVATDRTREINIDPVTGLPVFRGDDGAFTIGRPDAPTTLVVFSDWACLHCQALNPDISVEFLMEDVASGAVNLEHRTFPTAGGDATRYAANLAECVDHQRPGMFWPMRERLFTIATGQIEVYRDAAQLTEAVADQYNLDADTLAACAAEAGQLAVDEAYRLELNVLGTPGVFVRDADGTLFEVTDRTLEGMRAAVYRDRGSSSTDTGGADESTQAAAMADMAATQGAAGQPTPTP